MEYVIIAVAFVLGMLLGQATAVALILFLTRIGGPEKDDEDESLPLYDVTEIPRQAE